MVGRRKWKRRAGNLQTLADIGPSAGSCALPDHVRDAKFAGLDNSSEEAHLRLLDEFRRVFEGEPYKHRVSTTGDRVASYLYEDLYSLAYSAAFVSRVDALQVAVNTSNRIKGKRGRRGDGTFGRVVPTEAPVRLDGLRVPRGPVASLEIGAEFKIGATKLIAQVDRVINDLVNQAKVFRSLSPAAINVAFVGVNFADAYTGYEGARSTEAKAPPSREARDFAARIQAEAGGHFDELLVLRFRATNQPPFRFAWLDHKDVEQSYSSALVRISAEYQRRFG